MAAEDVVHVSPVQLVAEVSSGYESEDNSVHIDDFEPAPVSGRGTKVGTGFASLESSDLNDEEETIFKKTANKRKKSSSFIRRWRLNFTSLLFRPKQASMPLLARLAQQQQLPIAMVEAVARDTEATMTDGKAGVEGLMEDDHQQESDVESVVSSSLSKKKLSLHLPKLKRRTFAQDYDTFRKMEPLRQVARPVDFRDHCAFLPCEVRRDLLTMASAQGEVAQVKEDEGAVLFVDISGFTALGLKYKERTQDAHIAADKLSENIVSALKHLTEICYAWQGDVAKFAGDALLCTWSYKAHGGMRKTMALVRRVAYEMITLIKSSEKLDIHGGIGCGKILRVYLHKEENLYESGLSWHLVTGTACVEATELLSKAENGKILARAPTHGKRKVGSKLTQKVAMFDSNDVFDTIDCNSRVTRAALFAQEKPSVGYRDEETWEELSVNRMLPFIPHSLRSRLEGGAIKGGEIKTITTMFVSFDYLTLSDAELASGTIAARKLGKLNDTFVAMTSIVERYHGDIRDLLFDDKGCVFIAAFGALQEKMQACLRCVKAAQDVSNTFSRSRVGVSTGQCYTGMCGAENRHDFVVIGNDVNLAARYMGSAAYGQVLVSKAVVDATRANVNYESHTFRRKQEKFNCFTVSSDVSSFDSKEKTTCVGRRRELMIVKTLIQEPTCNTALMFGPEGIGKSTIVKKAMTKYADRITSFSSAAFALEEKSAFYVLRQLLADMLGLDSMFKPIAPKASGMDRNLVQQAARSGLKANSSNEDPVLAGLREMKIKCPTCVMTHLLPKKYKAERNSLERIKSSKKKSKEVKLTAGATAGILRFFSDVLKQKAQQAKLDNTKCVVVVENLHWIDLPSFNILVELVLLQPDNVTFLFTTRHASTIANKLRAREMVRLMGRMLSMEGNFCQIIELGTLDLEETGLLVNKMMAKNSVRLEMIKMRSLTQSQTSRPWLLELKESFRSKAVPMVAPDPIKVDPNVYKVVHNRTHGDPTYIMLLVKYLLDRSLIVRRRSVWSFRSLSSIKEAMNYLPQDVGSIMRLRTNELSGEAYKLLKVAAVIGVGGFFSMRVLEKVVRLDKYDLTEDETKAAMEELQVKEFIVHVGESVSLKPKRAKINFRIARLFKPDDRWKFKNQVTQEAIVRCLPLERIAYLQSLLDIVKHKGKANLDHGRPALKDV